MISFLLEKIKDFVHLLCPDLKLVCRNSGLDIEAYRGKAEPMRYHFNPGFLLLSVRHDLDFLYLTYWTSVRDFEATWTRDKVLIPDSDEEITNLAFTIATQILIRSRFQVSPLTILLFEGKKYESP